MFCQIKPEKGVITPKNPCDKKVQRQVFQIFFQVTITLASKLEKQRIAVKNYQLNARCNDRDNHYSTARRRNTKGKWGQWANLQFEKHFTNAAGPKCIENDELRSHLIVRQRRAPNAHSTNEFPIITILRFPIHRIWMAIFCWLE